MKRTYKLLSTLGLITILGFGLTACSSSLSEDEAETEQTEQSSKENDESKEKATESKINSVIAKDLKLDKGWAEGTLDEDGNPTDNGTPNDDFAWATVVEKIEYSSNNLRVYVTSDFKQLDDEDRQTVIESAMRASYSGINKYNKMDQEDIKKAYLLIYTLVLLLSVNLKYQTTINSIGMNNIKQIITSVPTGFIFTVQKN